MTKRKKSTGPPMDTEPQREPIFDERDVVGRHPPPTEEYRTAAAAGRGRRGNSGRYDSGLYSGFDSLCDDFDLTLPMELELEELDDDAFENDQIVVNEDILVPLDASSPMQPPSNERYLQPPPHHGFRRGRNGALTPVSRRTLRTLSEGDDEEFHFHLNHGRLSDPDIHPEVVAARLSIHADRLDASFYSGSRLPSSSYDPHTLPSPRLIARILAVAAELEREYFSKGESVESVGSCRTSSTSPPPPLRSLLLGSVVLLGSALALWSFRR